MKSQQWRTKVRAASATALLVCALLLTACTPTGLPTPNPDHGPATAPRNVYIDVQFNVHNIARTKVERNVVGEAKMIDKQGKPMVGTDEKTGQTFPLTTPFRLITFDGEAHLQVSYTPGTALYMEVSAHLQGYGGDRMTMALTNRDTGALVSLKPGGNSLCKIDKNPGQLGACTVVENILVTT
jgi:hypothetical protein